MSDKPKFLKSEMQPMMILPPDALSADDVARLNANGICTVVAKNPGAIRFVDPIPAMSSRTQMEHAAILLSRRLLNWEVGNREYVYHKDITTLYVNLLIRGSSLDSEGTKEEQEAAIYDFEHEEELRRLARADAKAAHAKKKELAAKKEAKP